MQTYGNTKSFAGFTIIDENGTQFIYGGSASAIEYEIGFFSQHLSEWIAQSWHLTKITDVYGNEINLTYERDSYINQMYISVFNHLLTRTLNSGGVFNPQPACSSMSWYSLEASFQGKLIAPVYLKSIYGSMSRIDFQRSTSTELRYGQSVYDQKYTQYNDEGNHLAAFLPILAGTAMLGYPQVLDELQWKKLDKIDVKDDAGAVVKSFAFTYTSSTAERLRLLSLKEYGKTQDASKPPYQFFYDSSVPLPGYLANKTDHWGFYNGTFASLLPVSNYYYNYYNFKEPNSTYLLAGTLNKIVYPTGGVTEFTFEPHRYSKRLQFVRSQGIDPSYNTNTLAGGIRIKKIVSYDPNNADAKTSKEYFYVRNFSNAADPGTLMSSGVLGGQIKYYFDDYRSIAFNDNGIHYSQSIFSSQSVLPACSNSQGSHVGYSEVIERDADGGYIKYYFSNFETGNVDEPANSLQVTRTAYEPYTSVEAERGQLLKEELFSADDIRLKQKDISYIALNKSNEFVRAMSARYFNVCPGSAVSCSEGVAYKNYTYSYLPVSEIVTTYDETGANPQVRVKRYEYDPGSRLCRSESVTDSKGLTTTVEYKYPFDFSLAGTVTNAAALGIRYLQDNGVTSWPVETIVALSDGGANSKVISSTYSRFSSTQAVPVQKFTLDVSEPILGFSSSSVSGGSESIDSRYSEKVSFDEFDVFGNMTQMHKQDDVNEVVVWGYNGQYPVAKVIGSDYAAVMSHLTPSIINSPSNDLTMRNELNKIRTNIPGTLVTTYTYMPLVGMTSETGPGGRTFFYEYDNFQRLKCVKDHDGNVTKTFTYNFRP